jgi:hypothetical protein
MSRLEGLLETSPVTRAAMWALAAVGMVGGSLVLSESESAATYSCRCDDNHDCGSQEICVSDIYCVPVEGKWGKCEFVC